MASAPLLVDPNCPQFKDGGSQRSLTFSEVISPYLSSIHLLMLWFHLIVLWFKSIFERLNLNFLVPSGVSQIALEIKKLYGIAFPLILTALLTYGKSFISMLFLGKIGKDALAGGSLAIGIANITGYSVISGLALGMDAISSQAFGANRRPLMAQTLTRTVLILLTSCLPISILWVFIKPVLVLCKQDPRISSVAATYLIFCLPDLLFQAFINPIKIYMRSQNITAPLMVSAGLGLAFHVPINYLFVNFWTLEVPGIAMAAALTDLIILAALVGYLYILGISPSISFSGLGSFSEWKSILALAFPSCVSVCLEWWWYELMILLSGLLPDSAVPVATMGIIIQATALVYIFPSSLSHAASTRVGNELGANRPDQARIASHTSLLCAVVTSVIAMSFMMRCSREWGRAFTDDEVIVTLTATVLPLVGLCELGNCPQTTGCGVLRGSARPDLGAQINFLAFYAVGLPVAVVMGFVMKLGLLGLMMGLLAAQAVCAVVMVYALFKTNWGEEVERARMLIGEEKVDEGGDHGGREIDVEEQCA